MTVKVSQILQKPRESNPAPQIISGLKLNENIENSPNIFIKNAFVTHEAVVPDANCHQLT